MNTNILIEKKEEQKTENKELTLPSKIIRAFARSNNNCLRALECLEHNSTFRRSYGLNSLLSYSKWITDLIHYQRGWLTKWRLTQ